MSTKIEKAEEKAYAITHLLEFINPGDTIYTILRKVSASGMQRQIDCYFFRNNEPYYLSGLMANALDRRLVKVGEGIVIRGCGMDMGTEIVSELSSLLFKDGYALKHRWL